MKRILLVDDEPNILFTIKLCLEAEGFEVFTATNGVDAVELAYQKQPDLILLDVRIPKMNGFLVCEALKENLDTKKIPLIFLSAKAEEEDIKKGIELGAEDYFVKPLEPEELIQRVKKYISMEKE